MTVQVLLGRFMRTLSLSWEESSPTESRLSSLHCMRTQSSWVQAGAKRQLQLPLQQTISGLLRRQSVIDQRNVPRQMTLVSTR